MRNSLLIILTVIGAMKSWSQTNIYPSTGNVGLGTTSPVANLDVRTQSTSGIHLEHSNSRWIQLFSPSLGNGWYNSTVVSGDAGIIFGTNFGLNTVDYGFVIAPHRSDNSGLKVASNGNVGIGTLSPSAKLEITETGTQSAALKVSNMLVVPNLLDGSWNGISRAGDAGIIMTNGQPFVITTHQGATSGLRMDSNGNIGIRTSYPDAALTVKGDIHTREVKVDLAGAVGPDYVFEKDYPLTSLEELKSYIDQNKHLPEIPSAKEMEEEGINLKEMNLLLLKKVEELTLHLIQKEEDINSLKASADSWAKNVEELTLYLIEQAKLNQQQNRELDNLRQLIKENE